MHAQPQPTAFSANTQQSHDNGQEKSPKSKNPADEPIKKPLTDSRNRPGGQGGNPSLKKRIAVLDFDYSAVKQRVYDIYGTNQDVGKSITDLLVEKLTQDSNYSVIERKSLDKILAEQNFSNNNERLDPATAQKIGQILGVDAIIIGSVTEFGRDDRGKRIGGIRPGFGGFDIGGVKKKEARAICAISVRLIDTKSGEILAAAMGEGKSKRSRESLIGQGDGTGGGGAGSFDTNASNFGQTLLGEAVLQAVGEVGSHLDSASVSFSNYTRQVFGQVANVSGDSLIINVGSEAGLKIGDKMEIRRADHQIKDPTTGKVLATITNKIGEGIVTEIDTESATLVFSGNDRPKVGDLARNQPE